MCFPLADYHGYGIISKNEGLRLNVTVVRNCFIENADISLTLFLRGNRVVFGTVLDALNITLIDLRIVCVIAQFK